MGSFTLDLDIPEPLQVMYDIVTESTNDIWNFDDEEMEEMDINLRALLYRFTWPY